jgi:hypothetical protein
MRRCCGLKFGRLFARERRCLHDPLGRRTLGQTDRDCHEGFVTPAAACWMYVGGVAEGMRKSVTPDIGSRPRSYIALYSTVSVTALFNFYNRLVDGVGLDLPDRYITKAAKRLSTKGYDVFAQMAQT